MSRGQRVALGISLALGSLLCLGLWAAFALVVSEWAVMLGVAEGLQHTGGLDERTYAAGFALASVALLGLAVSSAATMKSRLQGKRVPFWRRRPGLTAIVFALPLLPLMVSTDINVVNLPDALTTCGLLFGAGLFAVWVPVWLVIAWFRTTRWLWRQGNARPYRAGLVTTGGVLLGLLGSPFVAGWTGIGALALVIGIADDAARSAALPTSPPSTFLASGQYTFLASGGLVESTRESFEELSTIIEPSTFDAAPAPTAAAPTDSFSTCIHSLMSGSPSEFDRAVGRLQRQVGLADAEDLASNKVLSVCSRHARNPITELPPYYNRAVTNAARDLRSSRRASPTTPLCTIDPPSFRDPNELLELREVERAICGLSTRDQEVLHLAAQDLSGRELATRLDISEDAARARLSRARAALRATLQ